MKKKVLIIGNGAKEFALAKKMSECNEIFVTPKSDGMQEFATCLDIRENNATELLDFVMENEIDMTIPVSELALSSNIVELFNKNNLKIFAPEYKAFKMLSDKASAKKILYKLRITTPKFGIFDKQNMVMDYLKNQKLPFVIKTENQNSAVVLTSVALAKTLVESSYIEKNKKIIIEDYVYGTPFSFYAVTDGYKALPIGSSITYKHKLNGNGGQLTSGMGACSPNYKLTMEHEYYLMDNVIYPTLDYLEIEGSPYLGILGINGILSEDGRISVLGYQPFMLDCDAAPVLNVLDEDLYDLFESCCLGSFSDEINGIRVNNLYSTSLVLNCTNKDNVENVITGLDKLDENSQIIFYPSVEKNKYLEFEAKNGSVILLCTFAGTTAKSVQKMYDEVECIDFKSKYYRNDICKINI